MPRMDGFELVKRIRGHAELVAPTIMMLTSAGQRADAERCRELGVTAYLMKPIRQGELRVAIARALGIREEEAVEGQIAGGVLGERSAGGVSLRVLLAEDNAVNQRLAVRLLEKRGHQVEVVANGREALAAWEKGSYDLVLMDVQMPGMDGLEATMALREKEREKGGGPRQQVIALTAYAMKGDRERCLAAGMDGYLSKPIRSQELDRLLATLTADRLRATPPLETAGRTL
jgi:two-component system, sensor histidine kinase and response regulator